MQENPLPAREGGYLRDDRKTIYLDGGCTTGYDVFVLEYQNNPRPIHPLDPDIASWWPS